MSQAPGAKGEFRFALMSVPPDAAQAVARELTVLFPLDLPNAVNIAQNAPMILIDKLTARQARNVGSYAVRLRSLGADVQVTSQPLGKLQVLRWPLLPDIAKRPATHVICPNCGARLQVSIHVPAAEEAPAEAAPPKEETEAAVEAAPPEVQPVPEPEAAPAPEPQPAPEAEPAEPAAPEPEPEEDEVVLEPVEEGDVSEEEVVLEEEPVELEEAPAAEAGPAAPQEPGQPVGGAGTCRVTLVGKIRGSKKRNAAELMAYYLGITEEEALAQLSKTVVTVAKDLTEEQAETCKSQFADIGVKVTVKG
jgi:pyruvate/2-oxoglutarate dehydrogenase complex dihydrolipoamide acyltransferase (E2) component